MLPLPRRGTVYGTLLNHRDALAALGETVHAPPYNAPPKAPVLYIKPRNTWVDGGDPIVVPHGIDALEIGGTLGLVIGRAACRVSEDDAMSHVLGYVIVNDVSIPHASYYRPSLRCKARDTFCPIGPMVLRADIAAPDALGIAIDIDGAVVQRSRLSDLVRPAARLLAEVSSFMTLVPGDILSLGVAANAPRARAAQVVGIAIDGLPRLENPLVAEGSGA
jgi:5-oxopent-3-ene-1,2,5-tricarboxylate decarboxylase/2-hydroxyhepta-2,4-diene-1,7-dioate isomerase